MNTQVINQPIKRIHLESANSASIAFVCIGFLISIAGHFAHLPVWVSAVIVFSLVWRLVQNQGYIPQIPRWLIVPFVLAGGIGVFATYWTITGRDAGLALLSVMASFKLLECHSQRDSLIVVFLCYFLVVTHFLFSQSIFIAVYMVVTILFLTTSLITLNAKNVKISGFKKLKISAGIIAYAIPLMIILFILVPRVPGPLWGITSEQRAGVTGLSDHMSPGQISNLIQNNEVAFRVNFDSKVPHNRDLYWRGPVLERFNGATWFQSTRKIFRTLSLTTEQQPIKYTMTMEANGKNWLLPLDLPGSTPKDSTLSADYELKSTKPLNDLKKYQLSSFTDVKHGLDDSFEYLMLNTEYPEGKNKKTAKWGKQLRADFEDDEALVNYVLNYFRQKPYFYTLNPPILGKDPIDEFLFDSKRGFCEHYSGSFALLMRTAGIPTRVVTGYQGAELNQAGNYYIIRQSDAHAWTEVWLEDKGWVRVDPTAAVSPDRVEKSLDAALPDDELNFRYKLKNPFLGELLFNWDNIQHQWNSWVLNYNQRKQLNFLKKLGVGIKSTADMVIALVILITTVTLSYALWSLYKNRPIKPPYFEQLFLKLIKKCKKAGFEKHEAESANAFYQRLQQFAPDFAKNIAEAIRLYNEIKYSPTHEADKLTKDLKVAIQSF